MKKNKVSNAVIRRLPRYYRHLDDLFRGGVVRISSNALSRSMGFTASQIRQDLSCFGEFGQQGYGYNVENLRKEVAEILGMNRGHSAVIVGTGNLGRALIQNFPFEKSGFALTAAFDVDPAIVGGQVGEVPVYHIDRLEEYLQQHPASVAVLTVPRGAAHSIADRLAGAGVRGIWNFTNTDLALPAPGPVVENVHFADSLRTLSYMITDVE